MIRVQLPQEGSSSKSHSAVMNECLLLATLLSTQKCTREIQRTSGKAARFEIARGYTADVLLNRTVLQ